MATRSIVVRSFAPALIAVLASSLRAQEEWWHHDGATAGELGAAKVVPIGDLDGDGLPDLLVGSFRDNNYDGVVVALRGADGSVLFTIAGSSQEQLATGLDALGDVDGDGVDDFIVTMPEHGTTGQAVVYSGADQSVVYTLTGPAISDFGIAVAAIGDVDGDHVVDFVVGCTGVGGPAAMLYSGATGTHLFDVTDAYAVRFGYSASRTGDVDQDGVPDFCIGDSSSGRAPQQAGSALIFSGRDGRLLRTFEGTDGLYASYGSTLADVGDVDGDGVDDLAVGSSEAGRFPGPPEEGGVIDVFSGLSGARLAQWRGLDDHSHFGGSVAGLPDMTGDGVPDILVGAADVSTTYDRHGGAIYLYSGATLRPIVYRLGDSNPPEFYGARVASAGDVDGDGRPDFAVVARSAIGSGSVHLLRGDDLYLSSNVKFPRSATTLNLTTSAGEPGKLAMLVVEDVDGTPFFIVIATHVLNAEGDWHLLADVPPGLTGHAIALRAYAPDAGGKLEKSTLETIRFD